MEVMSNGIFSGRFRFSSAGLTQILALSVSKTRPVIYK